MTSKSIPAAYCIDLEKETAFLQKKQALTVLIAHQRLRCDNFYYQQGYPGTLAKIYTRQAVVDRLEEALQLLPEHLGLHIFDVYRSLSTQAKLFDEFHAAIRLARPDLQAEALEAEVRKFVSHPHEPSRFLVPPHNSGGAVDLALFDLHSGQLLDFGTGFDDLTAKASTAYFEQPYTEDSGVKQNTWKEIQENRRLLYHCLRQVGFINLDSEWWHYGLGDCLWAQQHNSDWFFPSMEQELNAYLASSQELSETSTKNESSLGTAS